MLKTVLYLIITAGMTLFAFVMMNTRLDEDQSVGLLLLTAFATATGYALREFYFHVDERLKNEKNSGYE